MENGSSHHDKDKKSEMGSAIDEYLLSMLRNEPEAKTRFEQMNDIIKSRMTVNQRRFEIAPILLSFRSNASKQDASEPSGQEHTRDTKITIPVMGGDNDLSRLRKALENVSLDESFTGTKGSDQIKQEYIASFKKTCSSMSAFLNDCREEEKKLSDLGSALLRENDTTKGIIKIQDAYSRLVKDVASSPVIESSKDQHCVDLMNMYLSRRRAIQKETSHNVLDEILGDSQSFSVLEEDEKNKNQKKKSADPMDKDLIDYIALVQSKVRRIRGDDTHTDVLKGV
jgi:hypothetical protein